MFYYYPAVFVFRSLYRKRSFDLTDIFPVLSLTMQALKVNQVCQWLRKAYQDPEDWMASQDCQAHQVHCYYFTVKAIFSCSAHSG